MSRTLVTGGTGVFGSFVLRELVRRGERPVALSLPHEEALVRDIAGSVEFHEGDVGDGALVAKLISRSGITHIVHLAALMPPACQASPRRAVDVNVGGTVSVLDAARQGRVQRVVYASAKGIYGHIRGPHAHPEYQPLSEDYRAAPVNVYDATKYAGEVLALNYAHDLEIFCLRFATTFAPGKMARHGPLSLHSSLIENALLGHPSVVAAGGDQRDDMLYAGDVANGILRALEADSRAGGVYNIGSGVGVTVADFAAAVRRVLPGADIQIGPGLRYFGESVPDYYCVYDIARARDDLGYRPIYDLEAGVRAYVSLMDVLQLEPTASD